MSRRASLAWSASVSPLFPGRVRRLDLYRSHGVHRLDVISLDDTAFYPGFFGFYYYRYDWQNYLVTR